MIRTIRHSDSGREVRAAKYLTGYAERKKAGDVYDAPFVSYVISWQRRHGLTADGVIGKNTWTKIADEAPLCSASRNRTSAGTCALQELLNIEADGIFGSKTKAATAAYQAAAGLETDGICGAKTWKALITGEEIPAAPGFVQPVDYKQYDSRWGGIRYSAVGNAKQTIRSSGCGPTAMANIIATLIDKNVTPPVLADYALKHDFRTRSSGTAWDFFEAVAEEYRFSKFIETGSLSTLKACLDAGGYAVCSMGEGYWTSGGHYITAWKYDDDHIYCNDPASSSRKKQRTAAFMDERKRFFCFYR